MGWVLMPTSHNDWDQCARAVMLAMMRRFACVVGTAAGVSVCVVQHTGSDDTPHDTLTIYQPHIVQHVVSDLKHIHNTENICLSGFVTVSQFG